MDEIAHVSFEFLKKVMFPLLALNDTAFVGLSSPEGSTNHFSTMINLKDPLTGKSFFKVVDNVLICNQCLKLDKALAIMCNHVQSVTPWLNVKKTHRLKLLYKADPATAAAELCGLITDDINVCFAAVDIARFFSRTPFETRTTPPYIYITCDPSGGGLSQLAICSGYYDNAGNWIIICLDAEVVRADHGKIKYVLRRHIAEINRNPIFRSSVKIFIPESNLANEASHMASMVRKLPNVGVFWEKDYKVGVHKSNTVTDNYRATFDTLLRSDTSTIYFDSLFWTNTNGKTASVIKGEMRQELERYHYEVLEAKTIHQSDKQKITGKMGALNDDIAIAVLMGPYWAAVVRNNLGRVKYN